MKGKHKHLVLRHPEAKKLGFEFLKAQDKYLLTAKEEVRIAAFQEKDISKKLNIS